MTFSIVHISDLHFRNDHPSVERVRILVDDIRNQVKGTKAYVIFSGDLVNAGGDNLYESLLDQLFMHLDDICEATYLVPGNHDIQRQDADIAQCERFSKDVAQGYLYGENSSLNLANPFQGIDPLSNYNLLQGLISSYQLQNYFGTFDVNPDFSFVGLNSAWLCCPRGKGFSDKGKLKIDPAVIEKLIEKLPPSALKVCSFHHPLDWIDESVRQDVQNLITKNFDLVLFGHVHNPSTTSGKFNDYECLFLQAPAIKSEYSFGANAYSIVNVDQVQKRYEIQYRTFSDPLKRYVIGEELASGGVRYPSKADKDYWHQVRTGTKSGLLSRFSEERHDISFLDWYKTHIVAKSKSSGEFVIPNVKRLEYSEGQVIDTKLRKVTDVLEADTRIQLFLGPQDSGLTTASFISFKYICQNFDAFGRVPVYINLAKNKINRSSLISEAVNTAPIRYTHTEMTRLIDEGGVTLIFDQICLPETARFNNLIRVLDQYFSNTNAIIFCTKDGGFSVSGDPSKLMFNPLSDVVHELKPLDIEGIQNLIRNQRIGMDPQEVNGVLNNVVSSFRQMDEPLYPSSVALLIETLRQIPEFKPLNRVRLLDRYVECLLGRFDIDDVREGTFNSSDKLNFLAYVAGYFATKSLTKLEISSWDNICKNYENAKLLELPSGLLREFTEKGILFLQEGMVTFRADYLFSYFVAKEMHRNSSVFRHISDDESFYCNHRELVFYGELEGVDNAKLLDATHQRLCILEEEIVEQYLRDGIDFDTEWKNLLGEDSEGNSQQLASSMAGIQDGEPTPNTIESARTRDLNEVDRGRGIQTRHTISELEVRWYVAFRTYLQLVKHSTNLDKPDKLKHLEKAMETSELFIKSLAEKRDEICSDPVYYHSGILYIHPLAAIDPERAKQEFKYTAPATIAKVLSDLMTNPQLSPAIRLLVSDKSEIIRFLARNVLLDSPHAENRKMFVKDLTSSTDIVLQTCSLRHLKGRYLGYSIDEDHRRYYSEILDDLSSDPKLGGTLHRHTLNKKRMLADMKMNFSRGS